LIISFLQCDPLCSLTKHRQTKRLDNQQEAKHTQSKPHSFSFFFLNLFPARWA